MIVKLEEIYGEFNVEIPDRTPETTEIWIAECDRCNHMSKVAYINKELLEKWLPTSGEFYQYNSELLCKMCRNEDHLGND